MVETATLINPLSAPAPKPFTRKSIARCVKNEIGDMPLTLKQASNIPADQEVPFWTVEYEALDAQFADGNPAMRRFGSRLTDKNGNILDSEQRPFVNAQAFAGLGIVAYPADPSYNESLVIGNVFEVEEATFATGKPVYVPVAVLGPDYVFEGDVYVIPAKAEAGAVTAVVTGGSTATQEIIGNVTLENELTLLLFSTDMSKAEVRAALSAANFGAGLTLNGFGVTGLAVSGKLVEQAQEAGLL